MHRLTRPLVRAFLLGTAGGGRSSLPFAALSWSAPALGWRTPAFFDARPARAVTAAMVAGELIGDKLPQTPSRLLPIGLAFRVAIGGAGGAAIGYIVGDDPAEVALVAAAGVAGAAFGSYGGAAWREAVGRRLGSDLPGALIEDAAAVGLAAFAVRR